MLVAYGSAGGLPEFAEVKQICIIQDKLSFTDRLMCAWYRQYFRAFELTTSPRRQVALVSLEQLGDPYPLAGYTVGGMWMVTLKRHILNYRFDHITFYYSIICRGVGGVGHIQGQIKNWSSRLYLHGSHLLVMSCCVWKACILLCIVIVIQVVSCVSVVKSCITSGHFTASFLIYSKKERSWGESGEIRPYFKQTKHITAHELISMQLVLAFSHFLVNNNFLKSLIQVERRGVWMSKIFFFTLKGAFVGNFLFF